jgi:hypothetical protein
MPGGQQRWRTSTCMQSPEELHRLTFPPSGNSTPAGPGGPCRSGRARPFDHSPDQAIRRLRKDPDAGNHCRDIRPFRMIKPDPHPPWTDRSLPPAQADAPRNGNAGLEPRCGGPCEGEKIYFQEVIPWCQKSSTLLKRQKLQQETGPLCKLLKPFALNYWNILLASLTGTGL